MSKFKNLTNANKPREKLLLKGVNKLSDTELLAVILNSGSNKESVITVANKLIEKYDGINNIFQQTYKELTNNYGIGNVKACKIVAVSELCRRISKNKCELKYIKSSNDVYDLLSDYKYGDQEKFIVINLDSRGKIINYSAIYKGTIDELIIHPREIFNYALKNMAKSIIISHNHPSGNPKPSDNDLKTTKKLVEISKLTGINIIDHVIITEDDYYSMRENCDIIFI